jgi:predicted protein tyrosine phosphatase
MIIVCGLQAAQTQIDLHNAKSVIGILGPDMPHPNYNNIENHLKLTFNDINADTSGLISPGEQDAKRLIAFVECWDQQKPMLIHCWAGISRSTASAFAALCILRPQQDEIEIAQELRRASPSATPNRLITKHVDQILGRHGRMSAAVESVGRGANAYEGAPFTLRP